MTASANYLLSYMSHWLGILPLASSSLNLTYLSNSAVAVIVSRTSNYTSAWAINVTFSPLSSILPSSLGCLSFFKWISTASSITKFINSSNPYTLATYPKKRMKRDTLIFPSIRKSTCSYSQIWTGAWVCKSLNIRLMGGTITFLGFPDMLAELMMDKFKSGNSKMKIFQICHSPYK